MTTAEIESHINRALLNVEQAARNIDQRHPAFAEIQSHLAMAKLNCVIAKNIVVISGKRLGSVKAAETRRKLDSAGKV